MKMVVAVAKRYSAKHNGSQSCRYGRLKIFCWNKDIVLFATAVEIESGDRLGSTYFSAAVPN
jgi:hypothetical protein